MSRSPSSGRVAGVLIAAIIKLSVAGSVPNARGQLGAAALCLNVLAEDRKSVYNCLCLAPSLARVRSQPAHNFPTGGVLLLLLLPQQSGN